jgi:hypothetical protein
MGSISPIEDMQLLTPEKWKEDKGAYKVGNHYTTNLGTVMVIGENGRPSPVTNTLDSMRSNVDANRIATEGKPTYIPEHSSHSGSTAAAPGALAVKGVDWFSGLFSDEAPAAPSPEPVRRYKNVAHLSEEGLSEQLGGSKLMLPGKHYDPATQEAIDSRVAQVRRALAVADNIGFSDEKKRKMLDRAGAEGDIPMYFTRTKEGNLWVSSDVNKEGAERAHYFVGSKGDYEDLNEDFYDVSSELAGEAAVWGAAVLATATKALKKRTGVDANFGQRLGNAGKSIATGKADIGFSPGKATLFNVATGVGGGSVGLGVRSLYSTNEAVKAGYISEEEQMEYVYKRMAGSAGENAMGLMALSLLTNLPGLMTKSQMFHAQSVLAKASNEAIKMMEAQGLKMSDAVSTPNNRIMPTLHDIMASMSSMSLKGSKETMADNMASDIIAANLMFSHRVTGAGGPNTAQSLLYKNAAHTAVGKQLDEMAGVYSHADVIGAEDEFMSISREVLGAMAEEGKAYDTAVIDSLVNRLSDAAGGPAFNKYKSVEVFRDEVAKSVKSIKHSAQARYESSMDVALGHGASVEAPAPLHMQPLIDAIQKVGISDDAVLLTPSNNPIVNKVTRTLQRALNVDVAEDGTQTFAKLTLADTLEAIKHYRGLKTSNATSGEYVKQVIGGLKDIRKNLIDQSNMTVEGKADLLAQFDLIDGDYTKAMDAVQGVKISAIWDKVKLRTHWLQDAGTLKKGLTKGQDSSELRAQEFNTLIDQYDEAMLYLRSGESEHATNITPDMLRDGYISMFHDAARDVARGTFSRTKGAPKDPQAIDKAVLDFYEKNVAAIRKLTGAPASTSDAQLAKSFAEQGYRAATVDATKILDDAIEASDLDSTAVNLLQAVTKSEVGSMSTLYKYLADTKGAKNTFKDILEIVNKVDEKTGGTAAIDSFRVMFSRVMRDAAHINVGVDRFGMDSTAFVRMFSPDGDMRHMTDALYGEEAAQASYEGMKMLLSSIKAPNVAKDLASLNDGTSIPSAVLKGPLKFIRMFARPLSLEGVFVTQFMGYKHEAALSALGNVIADPMKMMRLARGANDFFNAGPVAARMIAINMLGNSPVLAPLVDYVIENRETVLDKAMAAPGRLVDHITGE